MKPIYFDRAAAMDLVTADIERKARELGVGFEAALEDLCRRAVQFAGGDPRRVAIERPDHSTRKVLVDGKNVGMVYIESRETALLVVSSATPELLNEASR